MKLGGSPCCRRFSSRPRSLGWTVLPVPATNVTDAAASAAGRVYVAGFAFVGGNGIYRSADGGSSWERVFTTPLSEYVLTLAADPADPRHVFAATRHAGFAAFTTACSVRKTAARAGRRAS